MYPNLLGQKLLHHLSNEAMAKLIGVSRNAYEQKMRSGRFTPEECKVYCDFFCKSFGFLFAKDEEIEAM